MNGVFLIWLHLELVGQLSRAVKSVEGSREVCEKQGFGRGFGEECRT